MDRETFIEQNFKQFEEVLCDFVQCKSVSSEVDNMDQPIAFLKQLVYKLFKVELQEIPTDGFPMLLAKIEGKSDKNVLLYGHYDTMPAGDLSLWHTDPFKCVMKDQRYYGRGAGDNKGQLLSILFGLYTYYETHQHTLPFNAYFIFDGEEEQGSPHLEETIQRLKNTQLRNMDLAFVFDGSFSQSGEHVVRLGNRGIFAFECVINTGTKDNHSGNTGNVMPNAAMAMYRLLNKLYDLEQHRVKIPHFYDGVPTSDEIPFNLLKLLPYDSNQIAETIGIREEVLPDKLAYYQALMYQPTFNISGLDSGYTGSGVKTIVPHQAVMKIDCRLVGKQNIKNIKTHLETYLSEELKQGQLTLNYLGEMAPSSTVLNKHQLKVIEQIIQSATGSVSVEPIMPGSVPNYVWTDVLNVPTITIPLANFDQNNHAPNENLTQSAFLDGIRIAYELAKQVVAF